MMPVLAGVLGGGVAGLPQLTNLIFDVPIDEGSGTSLANNGTLGGTGSIAGHNWVTDAEIGTALEWDGTTVIPNTGFDRGTNVWSHPMSFAITTNITNSEKGALILMTGVAGDGNVSSSFILGIGINNNWTLGNEILLLEENVGWKDLNLSAGTGVKRIGVVIASDRTAKIYVDGLLVGTTSAFSAGLDLDVSARLKFGGYRAANSTSEVYQRQYTAPFNKVRIWDVALTDAEMLTEAGI